ncbi:permease [Dethiobacter alkaliphilus]|uniref:permease n=1 Tax=Dethiobacter alkaliphilus TaxID=427926 RepID=UPI0022263744|nr:permease [Dethiobacter alkaliphilus]MCW3489648.1 permease [Dethiobacter alkaliphilus]
MFTVFLYAAALSGLIYSFVKDRQKTKKSLMVAKKAFLNIFPEFSAILILIAIVLTLTPPETIQALVGGQSGFLGMIITAIVGAVTLIPGFIAFPLAKSLLDVGAGTTQIVVFISTLMMVGFVTAPLEMRYFGKRQTLLRNGMALVYSFIVAVIVGGVIL